MSTEKLPLSQLPSWDAARDKGLFSAYSQKHCLYCGVQTGTSATFLRVMRPASGDWFLISPTCELQSDEEACILPIGSTCLKDHPEFAFAIVDKASYLKANPKGYEVPYA